MKPPLKPMGPIPGCGMGPPPPTGWGGPGGPEAEEEDEFDFDDDLGGDGFADAELPGVSGRWLLLLGLEGPGTICKIKIESMNEINP